METFPSIDGMLMLYDIIGLIEEDEFHQFGLPYFQELYGLNSSIKFLHNDAPCRVPATLLQWMGVNLLNIGFDVRLNELKELTQNKVAILGNLLPRDVLAAGKSEEVGKATAELVNSLNERSRIIMSCGGGMPPGVTTENISAFPKL